MRLLTAFCLLSLFFPAAYGASQEFDSAEFNRQSGPLEIQRVTPSGKDVSAERQIVLQFNRPVVPVGRMEREASEIPISISPQLECEWRWLNSSALACQLNDKNRLKPATIYRLTVMPGIKAEDGETLAEPFKHSFITSRPRVSYRNFLNWSAPGSPLIRVSFNLPVSRASVEKHVHFFHADKRVPLSAHVPVKEGEPQPEFASAWEVAPVRELPEGSSVQLRVEPGLRTDKGNETGVERRVIVEFDTFPEFRFLGVQCRDNHDNDLFFEPGKSYYKRCNPLQTVSLVFSTPVPVDVVKAHLQLKPDLAGGRKDYDPWQRVYRDSKLERPHRQGQVYKVWLPELLKAWQPYEMQAPAKPFSDFFGRTLKQPIKMQFATDHRVPDYHFEHGFSVLESGIHDSEVPIVVTNLKKLNLDYSLLNAQGVKLKQTLDKAVQQVQDIAFKMPLGIRDLLGGNSGVVQGTFSTTPPAAGNHWRDNFFFAQVTPFNVQVKAGHRNSLVWITDMRTGQPVEGVKLAFYPDSYGEFAQNPQSLDEAVTDANGLARLKGLSDIDPKLELLNSYQEEKPRLFLRASKGEDIALLALDYNFRVDLYELTSGDEYIYDYSREQYGHIHTWGTTAQGVYKVGDTVQYKILVRDQSNERFVPAPKGKYALEVSDPMGKVVHQRKEVELSQFGGLNGEFSIPKTAAVGWYHFSLKANFTDLSWNPLRVLVSDFTPSPFRVRTSLNGTLFEAQSEVKVETSANLHAGGPYVDAPTQLYARITQKPFVSKHPQAQGFSFDTLLDDRGDSETVHQSEARLNDKGLRETSFKLPETWVVYGRLLVESTVRDDRGKDVAHSSSAAYVGRDRYVGLKQEEWVLQAGKPAQVKAIVVDPQGEPVADSAIKVIIEQRVTKAARVKGAGNAYLTKYEHAWEQSDACELVSASEPVACEFIPQQAGSYRAIATIKDSQGREHQTKLWQWVAGSDAVVWESGNNNRLDMVAEKTAYQVGDTVRYLVKNPFPGARALITVERFGVLDSWVRTLSNSVEIIEVPVKADYLPGFYLSVLVVSPRVDKPLGPNQVDLGKPAFRMGYAKVELNDPYKQLKVAIQSDKPVYKPRETVTLDLHASAVQAEVHQGEPIELAVAVLDESVFDLLSQGRDYFDPYKGFYTLDELDVRNFNLLLRLVGRQKFEKKGANPGGDGGADLSLRSLFKFVSYWNPALSTDAEGKAQVQFPVPDNLTGWRVLAMAVTPGDLMGLSDYNFKVNQPLELRPVLPNQVTQGDQFQAGFSLMNRTDTARDVTLSIQADGPLSGDTQISQRFRAEPFKRQTVWLPLQTTGAGLISLQARASDDEESDALSQTLTVRKRRALDTAATYGSTTQAEVSENVQFPADIYPDTGGLTLNLAPTIISDLDGAFEYMRDYPYACWEQKLSKGVMASHYQQLRPWLDENLNWDGSAELPQQTLDLAADYQAPNGGMAYYLPQDERVSPYLSAYTALALTWLQERGLPVAVGVESKLHDYLQELLRKNVMPDFYSKGMASTVRAVALHALSKRKKLSFADLERYAPHLKQMSLFGKSQFLAAANHLQQGGWSLLKLRKRAADMILAQAVESGGKITFNETLDDGYTRILASPLRDQCAILSALVNYSDALDLPSKLARSIIATRKHGGHWENTQENLFCMNALIDYARVYEKDAPKMQVKAWLADAALGETAFDDVKNPPVTLRHDMSEKDPGRKAAVKIQREGQGRLYYGLRLRYALKDEVATAVNAGVDIRREYSVQRDGQWQLLSSPLHIQSGELVRVDLYLSLPAARNFLVVDDPVPGGLEPVNRQLATASQVAADEAKSDYAGGSLWYSREDWNDFGFSFWSFYHKELRHHAAIFYSEYLPAGNYHLAYVAQAIAAGEFAVMPAHAEEMYEPDVYGKSAPAKLLVRREESK